MTRLTTPALLAALFVAACSGDDDVPVTDAPPADAADCDAELPCPAPDAGRITVCGRLLDVETETVITDPAALSMQFFDALDYASNPESAMPVAAESLVVDACGRFVATDLPNPTFGFLAIVTDDASGQPDDHVPTGVSVVAAQATPARGLKAYAMRRATDAAWSASAGLGGATFASRGVLVAVFGHGAVPTAGVQIRSNGNTVAAASTFTFSDGPITRSIVVAQPELTGANGSVLVIDQPTPINFDGTGAEPAGCQWPSALAASIPGSVFVQHKLAETPGGAACP